MLIWGFEKLNILLAKSKLAEIRCTGSGTTLFGLYLIDNFDLSAFYDNTCKGSGP